MKRTPFLRLSIALAAALLSVSAWAQMEGEMTQGEVRKINKETQKITIKHGEIKNLAMPPMTMVFTAQPASLLDAVQVGDKVQFTVEMQGGKMVVTSISALPAATP